MAWESFIFNPPPGTEMCDFCSTSPTSQLYACRNFMLPRSIDAVFQHESVGAWSACDRCAILIDAGHWSALTNRALRRFVNQHGVPEGEQSAARQLLLEIHQLFKEHRIKEA